MNRTTAKTIELVRNIIRWGRDMLSQIRADGVTNLSIRTIEKINDTRTYVSLVNELCQKTGLVITYTDVGNIIRGTVAILTHDGCTLLTSASDVGNGKARRLACATELWQQCLDDGIVSLQGDKFVIERYFIDLDNALDGLDNDLDQVA